MSESLLEVRSLAKHFPVKSGLLRRRTLGYVKAVDGVDFAIDPAETFGLVGESGCGKTTVANLILLLHTPSEGEIRFRDRPLAGLMSADLKAYRRSVQAVFQDPYGALNPRMLRLAGELADGVLLNYLPASHAAWSVDRVREGGDATVYAYVHAGGQYVADRRARIVGAPAGAFDDDIANIVDKIAVVATET